VVFVHKEKLERREAGLDGQDVGGGTHEAIGRPSLDLGPECGELPRYVDGGQEGVGTVTEDWEEEGGGQSMAEEGREADPWRGESFDRHEGRLGFGQPFDGVRGGGHRGGEPVAQPPDLNFGVENRPIQVDRSIGDGVSVPVRSPVDELRLGD